MDPRQRLLAAAFPGQAPFSHSTASAFTNLAPLPGVPIGVPLTPPAGYNQYGHTQPAAAAYQQPLPPGPAAYLPPPDPRMQQMHAAPAASPAYAPALQPVQARGRGDGPAGGVPSPAGGAPPLPGLLDLQAILRNVPGARPAPDQAPGAPMHHQPQGHAPHRAPPAHAYARPNQAPHIPSLAGEELLSVGSGMPNGGGGGAGGYPGFGFGGGGGQAWQPAQMPREQQPGPPLAQPPPQQQQQAQQASPEGQEMGAALLSLLNKLAS